MQVGADKLLQHSCMTLLLDQQELLPSGAVELHSDMMDARIW
jgi:hypothetical protein